MDGHPLILLKHGGPSRKKASLYGKVAQIYFALSGSFLLCAQQRRQARYGERLEGQSAGRQRTIRTPDQGLTRGVRRSDVGVTRQKKIAVPVGRGREMIETIRQGLKEDGYTVSISKLCQWFGIPRRTVYYKPTKAAPKVKPELAERIKAMIEESPSFGYRTVAYLLGMNKNTVQRIFQLKGWQVKKRAIGFRPRVSSPVK